MFYIMYWHGRLVIPTFQRFCSSQQVAQEFIFPLISDITRAFGRGRKSFKDKKDLAYGTIEAMATMTGTQVTYTWSYSPKAKDKLLDQLEIVNGECQPREFKQQKCRDNRGYKKIDRTYAN